MENILVNRKATEVAVLPSAKKKPRQLADTLQIFPDLLDYVGVHDLVAFKDAVAPLGLKLKSPWKQAFAGQQEISVAKVNELERDYKIRKAFDDEWDYEPIDFQFLVLNHERLFIKNIFSEKRTFKAEWDRFPWDYAKSGGRLSFIVPLIKFPKPDDLKLAWEMSTHFSKLDDAYSVGFYKMTQNVYTSIMYPYSINSEGSRRLGSFNWRLDDLQQLFSVPAEPASWWASIIAGPAPKIDMERVERHVDFIRAEVGNLSRRIAEDKRPVATLGDFYKLSEIPQEQEQEQEQPLA